MDFGFSEEEHRFRKEVRQFLLKELPPGWSKRIVFPTADAPARDEIWALRKRLAPMLAEKGWLTMSWPKEYGGKGASHIMSLIFEEEMVYHGAPARDSLGIGMLGPTLILFGTEEQKSTHLKPMARGEIFWCEGFSEPEAGSDLASIRTRAIEDGNYFVINGQKVWTTGAHRADWCFFIARTDPDVPKHKGISFFLVEMKTPGITVKPIIDLGGTQEINEVFFDNVRVPKENLVGGQNQGWAVAIALLNFERSWIEPIAVCKRLLEEIVEYVGTNKKELLKNPVIRQRLSQIALEIEISRLLSYRVAWLEDKGIDTTYQASMSNIYARNLLEHTSSNALKLLGLYGQLKEGSRWAPLNGVILHRYLDAIGLRFATGTNEIQKNIIALRGLGLPKG
jgi:alkylation response protein AidB-like acyl-CoA dehydrogenase